ncbi:hypothetical protein LNTAR_07574 [Lentisphaera araneosa HTCC2155]|uniref:Sialate O-acetylesterase domain-containing protein n=1 Tax=Lentisphaera araneosa HTCC2155 TaxID=313628 RepID=A6DQZ6_9BACT|nr:sialate O-acetylesterase [Lentisphaera araneosa]EDM25884.1 hypothetical protein LNTAR_07574 [Lentisphaera araneosa HTCC2155]
MKFFYALISLLVVFGIEAKPLKVFILAGQSNMQGHAKASVIDYMKEDPKTLDLYKKMHEKRSKIKVCDEVFISYLTGNGNNNMESHGPLTSGFGARRNPKVSDDKIGPEFTFGIVMHDLLKEPVLIIKTAWGGKSLFKDFRPPSAGPYIPNKMDIKKKRYDTVEQKKQLEKDTGHYYRLMINHINTVLKDIRRVYPRYKSSQGYELAGFVWFQGWNDIVNRDVYPYLQKGAKGKRFDAYTNNLEHLIRDLRKDLKAPKLPVCIGVIGVGGINNERHQDFRDAMAAPAQKNEFKGNVALVQTALYWDERLGVIDEKRSKLRQMAYLLRTKNKNHANKDGKMNAKEQKQFIEKYRAELISKEDEELFARGASNAGYHYLGCAKTMAQIGEAFAKQIYTLQKEQK